MRDRSSRPRRSPRRLCVRTERRIIGLRVNRRWGPARIDYLLGLHPSTVHKVLARYGMSRLSWQDRATGRVIRRYEHPAPGDMVHVDIKKLRRIPDGGGHRVMDRAAGKRNNRPDDAAGRHQPPQIFHAGAFPRRLHEATRGRSGFLPCLVTKDSRTALRIGPNPPRPEARLPAVSSRDAIVTSRRTFFYGMT